MKSTAWVVFLFLVCSGPLWAEQSPESVLGKWGCGDETIEFMKFGIGRESNALVSRYFRYRFDTGDVLTLDFGAGTVVEYSISISEDELTLTDTNQQAKVFSLLEVPHPSCASNVKQFEGAMALYALDHEGDAAQSILDIIPAYLFDAPQCPDGGVYIFEERVRCSLVEHVAAP